MSTNPGKGKKSGPTPAPRRPGDAAQRRGSSGEGSGSALARMIEQERTRQRNRPEDEAPQPPLDD
ncbi:MAG: hypothetical protein HY854_10420 [Burkholderiales bacterium]|nr:hypothetical protein [Burkholderiales bacterium]